LGGAKIRAFFSDVKRVNGRFLQGQRITTGSPDNTGKAALNSQYEIAFGMLSWCPWRPGGSKVSAVCFGMGRLQ
jgi:hypothetical protein